MIISDQKGKEFEGGGGLFQDCRWDKTHLCTGVVTRPNKIAPLFFPERKKKKIFRLAFFVIALYFFCNAVTLG